VECVYKSMQSRAAVRCLLLAFARRPGLGLWRAPFFAAKHCAAFAAVAARAAVSGARYPRGDTFLSPGSQAKARSANNSNSNRPTVLRMQHAVA
jgi:hypothetical protein